LFNFLWKFNTPTDRWYYVAPICDAGTVRQWQKVGFSKPEIAAVNREARRKVRDLFRSPAWILPCELNKTQVLTSTANPGKPVLLSILTIFRSGWLTTLDKADFLY
jgi:hypothetical protein